MIAKRRSKQLRREAALLRNHPEEAEINAGLDAMLDTSDWPPYDALLPGEDEENPEDKTPRP